MSVKRQAERVVGEQPRRVGPVTRGLSMPDGVDDLAVLAKPFGGLPVTEIGRASCRERVSIDV